LEEMQKSGRRFGKLTKQAIDNMVHLGKISGVRILSFILINMSGLLPCGTLNPIGNMKDLIGIG